LGKVVITLGKSMEREQQVLTIRSVGGNYGTMTEKSKQRMVLDNGDGKSQKVRPAGGATQSKRISPERTRWL